MDHRLRPESKKHIIRCAHRVLLRDGAADFSIRQVAAECGSSVSGLYRHFSGRDELLAYASLMSLDEYYGQLNRYINGDRNSVENYFEVERIFAEYSFSMPEIFYNMYFVLPEGKLDEIMLDSFGLFENFTEDLFLYHFGKRFVGGGIGGRNLAMLERCYEDGFLEISRDELPLFNAGIIAMYRGFLDTAIQAKKQGEDTAEITKQYLEAHRLLHKRVISSEILPI